MSTTPTEPPAEFPAKKNTWETIITMTPVILTIIGTLLAGLSSSEMTQAQYYRSLAGQSQSKAGDQWGFFQAKRIRGQALEANVERLPVQTKVGKLEVEMLQAAADRLVQRLRRLAKDAEQLQQTLVKAADALGESGQALAKAADALVKTAAKDVEKAELARSKLDQELTKSDVKPAFSYLGTSKLPEAPSQKIEDATITELLKGIADRKPDKDLAPLVLKLKQDVVANAIETAEGNVVAFETAGKPVSRTVGAIGKVIQASVAPVASLHQAVLAVDDALGELPKADKGGVGAVRSAATALTQADAAARAAAEDLSNIFQMVRSDYDARRYRREADDNLKVAGLYEIQVRKHSIASDRHRDRSKQFFYGMLCAQAGVAIASLALAARQKSLLWGLAGVAGMTALAFSGWVYLYR
jgi:hypothetical protein